MLITSYGPDSDDDDEYDDSDVDIEPLPTKKKKTESLKLMSSNKEMAIGPQLPPDYVVQTTVEENELQNVAIDAHNDQSKNCIENVSASEESESKPAKETPVLHDIPSKPNADKLDKQADQLECSQQNEEIKANLQR